MLYSASGPSGGVLAYALSVGGAALSDQEGFRSGQTQASATRLTELSLAGFDLLVTSGRHAITPQHFVLGPTGEITASSRLSGEFPTAVTAFAQIGDFVYTGEWGHSAPRSYRIEGNGALSRIQALDGAAPVSGADLIELQAIEVGGTQVLLGLTAQSNAVTSYTIQTGGGLREAARLGASEGLGIAAPTGIALTEVAGQTYVVVAAAGSGSLSVLTVGPDGGLAQADHVIAETDVPLNGVAALDTVEVNGRAFVVTGGGAGGLTLFELLPNGRLLHLSGFRDTPPAALANATAVALHAEGDRIEVFASSESEPGISHLALDIGGLAARQVGSGAADVLTGDARNNFLDGGAGDDRLSGGDGADILIDGAGNDTLTGGAGADIFLFTNLDGTERVTDFELGQDRLDLSALGWIRSVDQIQRSATANGLLLEYSGKTIELISASGTAISPNALRTEDVIDMAHYVFNPRTSNDPSGGVDALDGTEGNDQIDALQGDDEVWGWLGNDLLLGGEGDDTLHGEEDDDTLIGGSGADDLRGGTGRDTVTYLSSQSAVQIYLNGETNTGDATGDTFFRVENLIGTQFHDVLAGDIQDNMLDAWTGNDRIHAGNGRDTVMGGDGNDTLHGDNEDDRVLGGSGNDHLTGGRGNDVVEGEDGDDEIWGWLGLDTLNGGWGNDLIYGQQDSDSLNGWGGDDTMFGGTGWDVLIGGDGDDSMRGDDQNDTLWGGDGGDTLAGDLGLDVLWGENGNDELWGWFGNDILEGGAGDDILFGEEDNDVVSGGAGNDVVVGGDGDDTLWGFTGADTLDGGAGNDLMRGEQGADVFLFFDGHNNDTIEGFGGGDVLDLRGVSTITDFADLSSNHLSQRDGHSLIETGTGEILLLSVAANALSPGDFSF